MSHSSRIDHEQPANMLAAFRVLASIVLIAIGVVLALYLAFMIIASIKADQPPGLVKQLLAPVAEKIDVAADQAAVANPPIDLAPDLKRMIAYVITFFMFLIPASIATKMMACGVQLMPNDAAKALQMIADKLKPTTN